MPGAAIIAFFLFDQEWGGAEPPEEDVRKYVFEFTPTAHEAIDFQVTAHEAIDFEPTAEPE